MLKKLTIALIILSASMFTILPAEKYAVLLTGQCSEVQRSYWMDTFLMWEMLTQEKGYKPENVFVIFYDGDDWYNAEKTPLEWQRYMLYPRYAHLGYNRTDRIVKYPATKTSIREVARVLKDERKITKDDFLFVWTYDHGDANVATNTSAITLNQIPPLDMVNYDNVWIDDSEFASIFNPLPAKKKVYWMAQCASGGFGNDLTDGQKNIFFKPSCRIDQAASLANDRNENWDNIVDMENEHYDGKLYTHGEFNYHCYSSVTRHAPHELTPFVYRDYYYLEYEDPSEPGVFFPSVYFENADGYSGYPVDGIVSMIESHKWADHYILSAIYQESIITDNDNIGYHTSLEYPTIIYNELSNQYSYLYEDPDGLGGYSAIVQSITLNPSIEFRLNNSVTELFNGFSISDLNNSVFTVSKSILKGAGFDKSKIKNEESDVLLPNSININESRMNIFSSSINAVGLPRGRYAAITFDGSSEINDCYFKFYRSSISGSSGALCMLNGGTDMLCDNSNVIGVDTDKFNINNHGNIELTNTILQNIDLNNLDGATIAVNGQSQINSSYLTCAENSEVTTGVASSIVAVNSRIEIMANSMLLLNTGTELNVVDNSSLTLSSEASLIVSGESRVVGNMQIADGAHIEVLDNSTLSFQLSQLSITAGTTLKLGNNAKLIIENGTNSTIAVGTVIELGEGAEIVVRNKGYLTANGVTFSYTGATGKWLGINCEGGSSVDLNNVNVFNAITGVSGVYNYKFNVRNSVFTGCDNGISVAELVPNVNYNITGNTLTGTKNGTGISITSSNGAFENNDISFFLYGTRLTLSSPVLKRNKIWGNKVFGILVSGQNAIPQLINTDTNQLLFLNNEIVSNGNTYWNPSSIFLSAQIGIIPYSSIYMHNGKNHIYSGVFNSTPIIPCISVANMISSANQNIVIDAENNYWGASSVNDDFFFEEHSQYSIDYTPYYTSPDGAIDPDNPASQSTTVENTLLTNAVRLESLENNTPAIKLYEHIIKKYVDAPEYYIAMARLPYLYAKEGIDNTQLITLYDEALQSVETSNKKFFKGMKVTTHIKGKRYDDAISIAEEMKTEAEFEEEVTLADINIAIANLLKDMEGKSRNGVDYAQILKDLQTKLTGDESKTEPAGITEEALPQSVRLYQNYPNPFNPVTQIKFDLTRTSDVKLRVYNVSGQIVAELADGIMNSGSHSVELDGSKLNSGVYYYTLEADGQKLTSKMVLTK